MENNISKSAIDKTPIFVMGEPENALKETRGSNQKKLLVVYEEEDGKDHLPFLEKILGAVSFDLEKDALILAVHTEDVPAFIALSKRQTLTHCLLFGVAPTEMGLYFEHQLYKPLQHQDWHFLFADALSVLAEDKTKKGALWAALQALFLS